VNFLSFVLDDPLTHFLIYEKLYIFQEKTIRVKSYNSLLDGPETGVQVTVHPYRPPVVNVAKLA
jgi:hypothetical protein